MLTAITRDVSATLADCALTYRERQEIDVDRAKRQHRAYQDLLRRLGVRVVELPEEPELPDAVFVEDTAVVVEELAVLAAPRLESRRREVPTVAEALAPYRPLQRIARGSLEGGDVLRIDRTLYVGLSDRTDQDGVDELAAFLAPHGYRVHGVVMTGCLHLKSACTYLGRDTVLINGEWFDARQLGDVKVIEVADGEPEAANALAIGDVVIFPAAFQRTAARLESAGFEVQTVDVSELQKAEAGVTCCSIVFEG